MNTVTSYLEKYTSRRPSRNGRRRFKRNEGWSSKLTKAALKSMDSITQRMDSKVKVRPTTARDRKRLQELRRLAATKTSD